VYHAGIGDDGTATPGHARHERAGTVGAGAEPPDAIIPELLPDARAFAEAQAGSARERGRPFGRPMSGRAPRRGKRGGTAGSLRASRPRTDDATVCGQGGGR